MLFSQVDALGAGTHSQVTTLHDRMASIFPLTPDFIFEKQVTS